jgi:hypothetical protein
MGKSENERPELTDQQVLKSIEHIKEAVIAIETALSLKGDIPEGMVMVAMARMIGFKIRQGTLSLGPVVRQEHVDGFCEIIKSHAFNEEIGSPVNEETP